MKQRILLPILLLVAVLGTSCVSQHNVERNYSEFRPDIVRLNLTMDDYQYLGDVTIDVEYKTYLGIFRKILTVNGEPYNPRFYTNTRIALGKNVKCLGALHKALYKVTATYPNADYIMPASYSDEVQHMLGGRIHKRSMTLKVYAIDKLSAEEVEKSHQAVLQDMESRNASLQEQVNALQQQLQDKQQELEKAQLDARINAQKNTKSRR